MVFYSQSKRKFAVVPAVVLPASLITRNDLQGYGSPLEFLPGQTGCQAHCVKGIPVFFRNYLNAVLYLLVVLLVCSCDMGKPAAPGKGDAFPRSELSNLLASSGASIDISAKTLVVNFWATWCHPCRQEMPALQKLSDAMDSDNVVVLGISVDDDRNLMREFLYQHKIRFINLLDSEKRLAQALLKIQAYPQTFIVSPGGNIVRRISGQRDWNDPSVHRLLESISQGENLSRAQDCTLSSCTRSNRMQAQKA